MLRDLICSFFGRFPLLALSAEVLTCGPVARAAEDWHAAQVPNGALAVHDRLPVAVVGGTAEEIGAAEGALFADRVPPLLKLMAWQPKLVLQRRTTRFRTTLAAISAETRSRLTALAASSGVAAQTLLEANALVDAQCSATVAMPHDGQPLRVARNMDFFPAGRLGPGTVLEIVRPAGQRPYASITWPGSAAVISGMNDAGLVACILLNHHGENLPGGEPIGLRLAAILAHESDVAGAMKRFAATPVGSSQYVLLADAQTTTIIWQTPEGLRQDQPRDGWLIASNGARRDGTPTDARGRFLDAQCRSHAGTADQEWMRRALTTCYMPGINAQAMVFEPATCTLELAVGTGVAPAATAAWWRIPLAELLNGTRSAESAEVASLTPCVPLPHYIND